MPFVCKPYSYVPQSEVPAMPEDRSEAILELVKGTRDDNHARSRGLVGRVLPIPARYWGAQFARESATQVFDMRIIAFVPGESPPGDRWLFWDHTVDQGSDGQVLPLTKKTIRNALGALPALMHADEAQPAEGAAESKEGEEAKAEDSSDAAVLPADATSNDSVADDTSE